jgi:phage/plasmid primase-like uncharacterized protein
MSNMIIRLSASLVLILALAASALAVEVAQGKCVKYDPDKKIVTIEDYDTNFSNGHKYGRPTGKESVYNLATALIGVSPTQGDILRIAYELKGTERVATKVMNVSKQDLMRN